MVLRLDRHEITHTSLEQITNNGHDIPVPANILKSRKAELIEKGDPMCNRERQTNTLASCFVGQSLNWIQRLQWSHPEIVTEPEDKDKRNYNGPGL
jgi:hypothetical protein